MMVGRKFFYIFVKQALEVLLKKIYKKIIFQFLTDQQKVLIKPFRDNEKPGLEKLHLLFTLRERERENKMALSGLRG